MVKSSIAYASALLLAVAPAYLTANDGTLAKTASSQKPDPDQKIKCRKVEVSGSLIKKGRVCKTVAEWRDIMQNGNRTARAIVESGQICAGQCGGN